MAIPVVGSFALRYSPEAASLWSGSCGVQLSVVVYDKTVDRKRQFNEHSALVNIKIIRTGFSLLSNSGIQAGLSTGWGTRLNHFRTMSGKWMITTEVSFVNEYTAIMPYEICLKSNQCKQPISSRMQVKTFEFHHQHHHHHQAVWASS